MVQAAGVAVLLGLGGCSTMSSLNPVDWWHNLEGGPIADARPPPPNADAPYPSLGSVPDRPAGNDIAARGQIANALVADRANAEYNAATAPLAPSGTNPLPALPRPPPALPPAGEDSSNATLAAASAPPAPPPSRAPSRPPPPPRAAPRAAVEAAPLPPPPAPPVPVPPAGETSTPGQTSAPGETAAGAALPEMPPAPPAPPALPGVRQATAATPPIPTPAPPAPASTAPVAGVSAPVSFPPGSAVLPSAAFVPLRTLLQQRGSGTIAVVGFGAAADTSPSAQQAAMPLALARARAIAAYLETIGVPAGSIRIDAEAVGQGGVARLIH